MENQSITREQLEKNSAQLIKAAFRGNHIQVARLAPISDVNWQREARSLTAFEEACKGRCEKTF